MGYTNLLVKMTLKVFELKQLSKKAIKCKTAILLLVFIFTSCLPFHAYIYTIPDEKDIHRFKHAEVKHASKCYEFYKRRENKPIYVTNWTSNIPLIRLPLNDFLKKQKAKHFLVIKNDSIVFEYLDPKFSSTEPMPSFSLAKVFVSCAMGIAIKEGKVGSVNDLVKAYLPELNYHENFDFLTINHLLNQTSGIASKVDNISDANYGKVEKVLTELHFRAYPGVRFEYVNINTILLGIILERTTKMNLHEYFSNKVWSKIGTCDSTIWGYDFKTNHTRSFSSFGASARDYAKFGLLYMNKGKWDGEQVLDSNWVLASTSIVNGLGENVGYNNNWFIGEKEIGDFLAIGMFRQQIYINPKDKVVIVSLMKFNTKNLPVRWWELLRQISNQS